MAEEKKSLFPLLILPVIWGTYYVASQKLRFFWWGDWPSGVMPFSPPPGKRRGTGWGEETAGGKGHCILRLRTDHIRNITLLAAANRQLTAQRVRVNADAHARHFQRNVQQRIVEQNVTVE